LVECDYELLKKELSFAIIKASKIVHKQISQHTHIKSRISTFLITVEK